jgi:hypothetical protein
MFLHYYHVCECFYISYVLFKDLKIKIHKTIIISVVLYAVVVWCFIVKNELRLMMFENRLKREKLQMQETA